MACIDFAAGAALRVMPCKGMDVCVSVEKFVHINTFIPSNGDLIDIFEVVIKSSEVDLAGRGILTMLYNHDTGAWLRENVHIKNTTFPAALIDVSIELVCSLTPGADNAIPVEVRIDYEEEDEKVLAPK